MGLGGFLKKIGNNTLHDAEGIVDPRNYYRAGKLAVTHPIAFGEDVGKSYLDLARHPIRSLEHPLTTTLSLLPVAGGVGKLADVGVMAGAGKYASLLDKAEQGNAAGFVRASMNDASRIPGARAARMAKAMGVSEKTIWNDLKYKPGKGGDVLDAPGLTTDRGLLAKLHASLGSPNTSYGTDFALPGERALGAFQHGRQAATALAHPQHLLPGSNAEDVLTQSLLHEARHGYQKANWSRLSRYRDIHRPYASQKMELDANAFSNSALPLYKGLVSLDRTNPRIPEFAKPTIKDFGQAAKAGAHPRLENANDFNGVNGLINDIHGGNVGMPSEDEVLNHMDHLVATGQLTRDEAIQLQMRLADNPYEMASYRKPTSQTDLLRKSMARARMR